MRGEKMGAMCFSRAETRGGIIVPQPSPVSDKPEDAVVCSPSNERFSCFPRCDHGQGALFHADRAARPPRPPVDSGRVVKLPDRVPDEAVLPFRRRALRAWPDASAASFFV